MAEIDRVAHEGGELWLNTSNQTKNHTYMSFDPAWVTAAVNSLKVSNAQIKAGNLQLTNAQGTPVGRLYVDGDVVKFEGNFDESAREFLRTINLGYKEQIENEKARSCHAERQRCLDLIDSWAENTYALVTDLVKQIKAN